MDLTPDVLHQQEFREARRGYDMREVDEFLERVAVAVEQLLERLHGSIAETDASRARIGELEVAVDQAASQPVETSDESIQRTLLLAQKTADAAVSDAEAQASKAIERAEQQAGFIIKEAESTAERSRLESESQARRAGEETRRRMLEEITTLERTREAMHGDVRALRRFLDDQRTRMRTAARDLQRLVEDPTALKEFAPPVTTDQVAEPTEDVVDNDAEPDLEVPEAEVAPAPVEADASSAPDARFEADALPEPDEMPEPDQSVAVDDLPPPPPPPGPMPADTDDANISATADDPAEPTGQPITDPADAEADADYFEELRRAMNDGEGASPG